MSPRWRRRAAAALLVATLIGWPVSLFTVAKAEPPWVLSLSWLALSLTCLDVLASTDVRVQQSEKEADGDDSG
jgi:hypothetical protein